MFKLIHSWYTGIVILLNYYDYAIKSIPKGKRRDLQKCLQLFLYHDWLKVSALRKKKRLLKFQDQSHHLTQTGIGIHRFTKMFITFVELWQQIATRKALNLLTLMGQSNLLNMEDICAVEDNDLPVLCFTLLFFVLWYVASLLCNKGIYKTKTLAQ